MIIPVAMDIYSAQDALKCRSLEVTDKVSADELKELRESNAGVKCQNQSDFEYGYLLGLEVARVILAGELQIYQAGLKPADLL